MTRCSCCSTGWSNQIPALITAFSSEWLLYGSNYCWIPAAGAAGQIVSVDEGETWRTLTIRNATWLFPTLLG